VDMESKLFNALQLSAYVLRQGKVLCVFPEGSRSRDGKIKEFKKGVGIIAKELNVPLVPVAITGTFEMMRPGQLFPGREGDRHVRQASFSGGHELRRDHEEAVRRSCGDAGAGASSQKTGAVNGSQEPAARPKTMNIKNIFSLFSNSGRCRRSLSCWGAARRGVSRT